MERRRLHAQESSSTQPPAPVRRGPATEEATEPLQRTQPLARTEQPSVTRRSRRRLPTAAWVCFGVALANGIAWGLITPLFQVPDEAGHVAYVQRIAEGGTVPTGAFGLQHFSPEERHLLDAMRWKAVQRRRDVRVPGTAAYQKNLQRDVSTSYGRDSKGGYTTDTNNPPLYYFTAAGVYHLSPWTSLADRVHAMRLLSALLAACTVLLIFLFLRELLPSTPWAWTVGALAVAFQPMFAFTASGVTSDTFLYPASAGVFYALALCFRRGLNVSRGLVLGAFASVGLLAKMNMVGLLPGIAVGVLALTIRTPRERRPDALNGALAAFAIVAVPLGIYMLLNSMVWDRGLYFGAPGVQGPTGIIVPGGAQVSATFSGAFDYMWEFYLPRLPSMHPLFPAYPLRDIWFDGFIGDFGWLDYRFSSWVYDVALIPAFAIVALAGRELYASRRVVRERLGELITYLSLIGGLLVLIGGVSYIARLGGAMGYEQPRYLFPLLALYGALVAFAARGAGRRFGPAVGVFLVCLAVLHTAAAMLLTVTRYYG
jgi:4-amino-4-deoxy-L-arabinose transferase-like glycosyltransferase